MSLCTQGQCTAPPLDKLLINQAGKPKRGEIFKICAAMKHPLLDHVNQSGVTALTYASPFQDGRSRCSKSGFKDGAKPCIISQPATAIRNEQVYLILLFDPAKMSEIPSLLRHYLVPMRSVSNATAPLGAQYDGCQEHLHTNPSWAEGTRHWVIAIACDAEDGALSTLRYRRRATSNLPEGSDYEIDSATMREFDFLCAAKQREWASQSEDQKKQGAQKFAVCYTIALDRRFIHRLSQRHGKRNQNEAKGNSGCVNSL